MRHWLLILFVAILAAGCVDKERAPVMGTWTGGFYTDKGQAFKGYLTLYRTGDKFKMRLASKDQAMDFEGTWTIGKHRIALTTGEIKFENPTEEDQKALGLKIVTPDEVWAAYAKPVAFDLDASDRKLTGLTVALGSLSGRHEFGKGEVTKNTKQAQDRIRNGS